MSEVADKTEFTYAELSPQAKERALEQARSREQHFDWWGSTYGDAVRIGALLGIDIATKHSHHPSIYFSGFCSQGDGACYTGHYSQPAHDVVAAVTEHAPQDTELKRIAEGLTVLQVTARMKYGGHVSAIVTTSGNYCHSGTMNVEVDFHEDVELSQMGGIDADLTQLLRDFADWIYERLEAENDYMYSEEYIAEGFEANDNKFDEDGVMI